MSRHRNLCLLSFSVLLFILVFHFSSSFVLAALPTVKDGDLIEFGYTLVVDGNVVEKFTSSNPLAKRVLPDLIRPPGLYKAIIGMTLEQPKDVVVPPEDGFTSDDLGHEDLIGKTLYYYGLEIYSINGKYISDFDTGGNGLASFGYYFIRVVFGLFGVSAFVALSYGVYRLYRKFFSKRCIVCKKPADGRCKKCGRYFCKTCYATGCPYCGSRKLVLFK